MGFDFRMPNIVGNDREQLQQIRSYLYQFIPQLQWALNSIDTSSSSAYISPSQQKEEKPTAATAIDAETAFNVLKPLIIKSADIVMAYYEEINTRLSGEYVAKSTFGEYTKETESLKTETSEFTKTTYSRFETIESDLGNFKNQFSGYIKTGTLVDSLSADEAKKYGREAGDPLIGIEVGEEDADSGFRAFARFVSNRLSFYDNSGIEVAYISNFKLFINNAEITVSLKIGGIIYKVLSNGDVVEKWEGVNG